MWRIYSDGSQLEGRRELLVIIIYNIIMFKNMADAGFKKGVFYSDKAHIGVMNLYESYP